MEKIYYTSDGWVCNRYPYDLKIEDESLFLEFEETDTQYWDTFQANLGYAWRVVDGKLTQQLYEKDAIAKQAYMAEFIEVNSWFKDNDWKVNKFMLGEWKATDQRWLDYLAEREAKRARQDELTELLKQL